MKSIVVTVRGKDRPGLVKLISDCATACGANWTDSILANFAGQFCGAIHLQVQDSKASTLAAALESLKVADLVLDVARANESDHRQAKSISLELVGNDRPGIIKAISNQLTLHGANIVKMTSSVTSAPMSGGSLFCCQAVIVLDETSSVQDLQSSLESLADELMVDLKFANAL